MLSLFDFLSTLPKSGAKSAGGIAPVASAAASSVKGGGLKPAAIYAPQPPATPQGPPGSETPPPDQGLLNVAGTGIGPAYGYNTPTGGTPAGNIFQTTKPPSSSGGGMPWWEIPAIGAGAGLLPLAGIAATSYQNPQTPTQPPAGGASIAQGAGGASTAPPPPTDSATTAPTAQQPAPQQTQTTQDIINRIRQGQGQGQQKQQQLYQPPDLTWLSRLISMYRDSQGGGPNA